MPQMNWVPLLERDELNGDHFFEDETFIDDEDDDDDEPSSGQPSGSPGTQLTQIGMGVAPVAASVAAGAPASAPPTGSVWETATNGGGRGGGQRPARGSGRSGVGAPVGEDFGGLDDGSFSLPESPTFRERLRSGMRRVAALVRMRAPECGGDDDNQSGEVTGDTSEHGQNNWGGAVDHVG